MTLKALWPPPPSFEPTPPVNGNLVPCCESYPPSSRHLEPAEQEACFARQAAHLMVADVAWWDFWIGDVVPPWEGQ
jgi:hypothetical protein